jgi:hypothetical protein
MRAGRGAHETATVIVEAGGDGRAAGSGETVKGRDRRTERNHPMPAPDERARVMMPRNAKRGFVAEGFEEEEVQRYFENPGEPIKVA